MIVSSLSRGRAPALWITLIALAIVWIASTMGIAHAVNAWTYSQYLRLNAFSKPEPQVLLVEAHREKMRPANWQTLVAQLSRWNPRVIAFLNAPPELLQRSSPPTLDTKLVLGTVPSRADNMSRALSLRDGDRAVALTRPPSQRLSDFHQHQPRTRIDGNVYSSTEATAARLASTQPLPIRRFLVDFRPGLNYLPLITAERAMKGDLISALVQRRVVLIGSPNEPSCPRVLTPLGDDTGISRLTYAGYVVDTLMRGEPVRVTRGWEQLLMLLLTLAIGWPLYHAMRARRAQMVSIIGAMLILSIGWLSLHLVGLLLPVAELGILHGMVGYLVARHERQHESQTVRQLLRASTSRLHERLVPAHFITTDDPWSQIIQLITQLLSLERVILLERVPGKQRLREVRAFQCSIDEIEERRRDFRRPPYSEALQTDSPILLTRPYLKASTSGREQFLAPLEFNGQVLAFLGCETKSGLSRNNPVFMQLLRRCADEIGELLYRRRREVAHHRREQSLWVRILQLNSGKTDYKSLQLIAAQFESRLSVLEKVFSELETSTILYDMFGQVVQVNRKMEELAKRAELNIFKLNAAEVLSLVGDMSLESAREHYQHMLLTQETLFFAALLRGIKGTFMLRVRALTPAHFQTDRQESSPFETQGFLMELTDVTHLIRLGQVKDNLTNNIISAIRNQLEAALLAAELTTQSHIPDFQKDEFLKIINRKMQQMAETLNRSQTILDSVQDLALLTDFPVNARALLEQAAERWQPRLAAKGIDVELDLPNLSAFVRVDIAQADPVLDALLVILAGDSRDGESVRLSLREHLRDTAVWVTLALQSNGYGMPTDRLRALLAGEAGVLTPEFHRIKQAAQHVSLWGGRLEAKASLGQGFTFEIHLPGFSIQD